LSINVANIKIELGEKIEVGWNYYLNYGNKEEKKGGY
jgi:hypothetical protein